MKIWLSLGAIAVVAACAVGEDNTDVQIADETTLPRCNTARANPEKSVTGEPPNAEKTVGTGADGTGAASSSSSGNADDCAQSAPDAGATLQ